MGIHMFCMTPFPTLSIFHPDLIKSPPPKRKGGWVNGKGEIPIGEEG